MSSLEWQTVVVTLCAVGALVFVLRPFLPWWLGGHRPGDACPRCAAGHACIQQRKPADTERGALRPS